MHQRYPDGKLTVREHLQRAPLYANIEAQKAEVFCAGGAGLFSQPKEYIKLISCLLNNGISPHTKSRILSEATVNTMFTNQIPEFPNFGREEIQDAIPELTNKIPELYSQPKEQEQGLPNLYWWCDRERGVGGLIASQILPFAGKCILLTFLTR
jgi:hypothetical protein